MIVVWVDQDGDPVAVDLARVVGLSVGDVAGPRSAGTDLRVTLIWTDAPQPFMVAAPFADVLRRWTESRGQSLAVRAHPETRGWEHQYINGVQQ